MWKTRKLWEPLEKSVVTSRGNDIGCGSDSINLDVRTFDQE
jgi:hypothetical protein